jgi:hypothetical protein
MGLCIYYSGRIKNAESLPQLVEEIRDISEIYGWKYHTYETHFTNDTLDEQESFQKIYGIGFTPPECETISLAFLSNGVMVCPSGIELFADSDNETQKSYIYSIFAKTQFAGMVIHATIINIFKYLNNKYLKDFRMMDESGYWETGDENIMRKNFQEYDALLDNFVLGIQTFPVNKGETMIAYFERLLWHVNKLENP